MLTSRSAKEDVITGLEAGQIGPIWLFGNSRGQLATDLPKQATPKEKPPDT